ncbi:deoxyribose-phosphate aldolase [Planococcus ruber]|uniref:deoxyribose-phosphate aldolase n=1 Tax=Planococcus ruber TaxID=2027871 RepID=UPI001FF006BB|nr:deoxyribose-phosphate aldolase [Planococcus ruber]
MDISSYIDHTLLKADATKEQVKELCQEAEVNHFATVCVNPDYVPYCSALLKDTDVKVCTVIGFPLGANPIEVKVFEAERALEEGAEELDYVINISDVKNGEFDKVKEEMKRITALKSTHSDLIIKAIFEVCYLTDTEIAQVSNIAKEVGIDYVKTSTGFGSGGASEKAVEIMKNTVGEKVKVKASGGIRTLEDAKKYIDLGVSRIGTSNGVSIVKGEVSTGSY